MQVALAWHLQRSPNMLLIPGTSSVAHLRENLEAAMLQILAEVLGIDRGRRPRGANRRGAKKNAHRDADGANPPNWLWTGAAYLRIESESK
jgi:diketogulonate reductase-like aldo/keto reductase